MMNFFQSELPFQPIISFESIINDLEIQLKNNPTNLNLSNLVKRIHENPELKEGFNDLNIFEVKKDLISEILSDLFPTLLTNNEIKAATIPLTEFTFNTSKRFDAIIKESGKEFSLSNFQFDQDELYIACCKVILHFHFNFIKGDPSPIYYEIKNKLGIQKYFRILYNADFLQVLPTENSISVTEDEIKELVENQDKIQLWKEKFPPFSWIFKGFGIMTLYDATVETALSNLKHVLLNKSNEDVVEDDSIFELLKSIFNISSLSIGYSSLDFTSQKIIPSKFTQFFKSYILNDENFHNKEISFSNSYYKQSLEENKAIIISDTEDFLKRHPTDEIVNRLYRAGIKSCCLIPINRNHTSLGLVELVSTVDSGFNSTTIQKLETIQNILIDVVEKADTELVNFIDALIQKEYTSIHPSVSWKFRREAEKFIVSKNHKYDFKDINFREVYALYGEIDIRNSSIIRNECIKEDLSTQLNQLSEVLDELKTSTNIDLFDQKKYEIEDFALKVKNNFEADTEQEVLQFISEQIHPILVNLSEAPSSNSKAFHYLKSLDPVNGQYYHSRKKFDDSVKMLNLNFVETLDEKQKDAQKIFPHYFERFSTDGVEHNMYIGQSIDPQKKFSPIYLSNLRLWQLQVICEMINDYQLIKKSMPIAFDVASLILAFNQPLTIRFRMDEKRFDIDGSYNARYEIVKKRLDKATILNSKERITQEGKVTIVYSHQNSENEYLNFIKFLQHKNILEKEIEFLQVEKLQGVSGLKALRVQVKFHNTPEENEFFTYEEVVKNLK